MPLVLIQSASRCSRVCHPSAAVMIGSDWIWGLPSLNLFPYITPVLALSKRCHLFFIIICWNRSHHEFLTHREMDAKHLVLLLSSLCIFNTGWCITDQYKRFESSLGAVVWMGESVVFIFLLEISHPPRELHDSTRVINKQMWSECWRCPWCWNEPMTLREKLH